MLGLGSNITKAGKIGKPIVKDGLVLKHGYTGGPVQPVSTGAVFLDGDNDEIVIGDVMDLGTDDFSITAWVKINTASSSTVENYIVSKIVDSDNTIKIAFNWATDKFVMTATGGGNSVAGHSTTTAITSAMKNSWIHVAFTCDRDGDSSVYINGVAGAYGKVIGSSNSSQSLDSSGGWAIGGNAAGTFGNFDGYICNVGIWKGAALTQPQIKSIMHKDYASLSDSEKTNLVSWWNLDSTISEDYVATSEADDAPSTISGMTLDNHDTTFTEVSVANSNFTSGSGTTITSWTNDNNGWTRVGNTVVSGASQELLRQSVLTNGVAHKAIIRAKRTTAGSAASLRVYFGGNNYAQYDLTGDFAEYTFHGYQDNDVTLFLYNVGDVTVDTVELYKYDGNVGILV